MTEPQEVDVRPIGGAILPATAAMIAKLDIEASIADDSGIDASVSIMEAILSATTEEDLFAAAEAGTVASKDFIGIPFTLKSEDIEWKRSRPAFIQEGGFPFFYLARVTRMDDGTELVINGGGKSSVAVLYKLQTIGGFDQYPDGRGFMFREKATASGQNVVLITPVNVTAPTQRGSKK